MEKEPNVSTVHLASEAEKAALESWKECIVSAAKENFLRDGHLNHMIFVGLEKEDKIMMAIIPVDAFMKSAASKGMLSELMKKLGKELEPVCICMVTEMWMTVADTKDKSKEETKRITDELLKITPSKHPDRQEGILCTFESENIQTQRVFRIVREPELVLGDFTNGDGALSMTGRFVNVLRDMKKVRDN